MEFGFILKKLISMWVMPLPFCCLLIIFGLIINYWRANIGRAIALLGVTALMLFSWQPFSNFVLYPLENKSPIFDITQPVDAIVVLGNCHQVNNKIPPMSQLCGSGLYRLMEGYRIWQANPEAELLLSGYAGDESRPYADVVGEIAINLGVPKDKIRLFPTAQDTQQEAELTAPFIKNKQFALVTSASHMQRSMDWFKRQKIDGENLTPIAAPAYFDARETSSNWNINTQALMRTERAWYELLGRSWALIKP